MSVQIGGKTQIAQWTLFNRDISRDDIQICDVVIDGITWKIDVCFREEPECGENTSNCMSTIENNAQRIQVNLKIMNTKSVSSGIYSPFPLFLGQIYISEDKVVKYYISYCTQVIGICPSKSCLLHIFLYKEMEALSPVANQ